MTLLCLELVLLYLDNMTNTNKILTVCIVFDYNISHVVQLWYLRHVSKQDTKCPIYLGLRHTHGLHEVTKVVPKDVHGRAEKIKKNCCLQG